MTTPTNLALHPNSSPEKWGGAWEQGYVFLGVTWVRAKPTGIGSIPSSAVNLALFITTGIGCWVAM